MPSNKEVEEILTAIHSRLTLIDGKATLGVRANKDTILPDLQKLIVAKPLVGQVYIVTNGIRTQTEAGEELARHGVEAKPMTLSRAFREAAEAGMIELLPAAGAGNVYRRDPQMESILSLSKNITKWLKANGVTVPVGPKRKKRAAKKLAAAKGAGKNTGAKKPATKKKPAR